MGIGVYNYSQLNQAHAFFIIIIQNSCVVNWNYMTTYFYITCFKHHMFLLLFQLELTGLVKLISNSYKQLINYQDCG